GGLINNPAIVTWNGNVAINDSGLSSTATSLTRVAGENVATSPYAITAGSFTPPTDKYSAPPQGPAPPPAPNPLGVNDPAGDHAAGVDRDVCEPDRAVRAG